MSHSTYNKLWTDAHGELTDLLSQELPPEPLQPEKDRVVFFQRVATLYVRYVQIFRQLEEAYDQIVHPQKRRLIRDVLDGVIGRVLELKNEMVEKEYSEYHNLDDVIRKLKLTPEDLEIPIPKYFIIEQRKVLEERAATLASILEKNEIMEEPEPDAAPMPSLEEAVRIIQVSERARQGRLRTKIMRQIHRDAEIQKKLQDEDLREATEQQAAVQIQKVWKGYLQRKRTKQEKEEEMIVLGMSVKPSLVHPCPAVVLAEDNKAIRRKKQEELEEDYHKATISITETLQETEGPDMKETMKGQIRQWFIESHDTAGAFPQYPDEEDGGSSSIFANKTPEQVMEELEAKEVEEEIKKPKEKEKEEPKAKGKKDPKKGEKQQEEDPGLILRPSAFLSELQNGHTTFTDVWQNRDESKNFSQRHEAEIIKEEKRKEIEAEIRLQVDELMRQELADWKVAVEGSKGKGKAGGKKRKKTSKGKKKKKKKEIDLTAKRSLQSLYEELVVQGLLKPVRDVKLHQFIGEYSYLGTTLRQTDIQPTPSLSDVRQVISLWAVLPLGSQAIHEKAPLVKSILLVGPSGVGKKMLVHAVCQETGANLFDLSASNLVGKYPGKPGLDMMLHMVFKVARLMQPSVVWIGDAEKMFYKKVPKEDKELEPKRLTKDLLKILKSIKAENRVLIMGTSKNPANADVKALCRFYNKIILIPRPDYASRFVMWKELIQRNGGVVTSDLDLGSLARISDGCTQGDMVRMVKGILTEWRIERLAKRPLIATDFVPALSKIDPVSQKEQEAFKVWYGKTPMGKKRAQVVSEADTEKVADKGGKDKKKKGKK